MSTISGTITHSVTLNTSGTYASPLTIAATGAVLNPTYNPAITGLSGSRATVVNFGIVKATGGGDPDGIRLQGGGTVNNATASAYIFGRDEGIDTLAPATVTNVGTIGGNNRGVDLEAGGSLANSGLIFSAYYGVRTGIGDNPYTLNGQTGIITNSGTITAGKYGLGVELASGGSVGNSGKIVAGSYGVRVGNNGYNGSLATHPGTVTNSGTITTTGHNGAGVELGSGGTVTNSGVISETSAGNAVVLRAGGTVLNLSTGTITAASGYGVKIVGTVSATVTNYGRITGPSGGIILYSGGLIRNNAGGSLSSAFAEHGALVENYGAIGGGGNRTGIGLGELGGPVGTVINTGTITGAVYGINLHAGGTVVDGGTISGAGGDAVRFGGTGGNLLALESGYRLSGPVYASAAAVNTLELLGSASGAVTVSYNALHLTNFQHVLFGPGGYETLKIANASGTLPLTVSGFGASSEIIDLTAIGTNGRIVQFDTVAHRLTIVGSGGTVTLQLDASDGTVFRTQSDGVSGTDLLPQAPGSGTTIGHGITLSASGTYASPLTIAANGYVFNKGTGPAVYGPATGAWTVANAGRVTATGAGSSAVKFGLGGNVANSGTLLGSYHGIDIGAAPAAVSNSGIIASTGTGGDGVVLRAGGYVLNQSGGTISTAGKYGIAIAGTVAGTVVNYGRITGPSGGAILYQGGLVSNHSSGYLSSVLTQHGGVVVNSGVIGGAAGNRAGIALGRLGGPSGTVVNTGTVTGATYGARLLAGGTVLDAGLISGAGGNAVRLGGTGSNLLALQAGYKLLGSVYGATGASNTLELLGSAAGLVTVSYNGLGLSHFQDVLFGPAGYAALRIANKGGTLPITISGFAALSDAIDLTAIGTDGHVVQFDTVAQRLTIAGAGGTVALQLDASDGASFRTHSDGASGTDLLLGTPGIGTTIGHGIVLSTSGAYQSPLTIAASGYIFNNGTDPTVYGPPTAAWTFVNAGRVKATGASNNAVDFNLGGSVGNSGTLTAYNHVIDIIGGAGTVTNSGKIASLGGGNGVLLQAGGTVVNLATGTISAASAYGVRFNGTVAGTIVNYGRITGPSGGVILYSGGLVDNRQTGYIGSVFTEHGGTVTNSGQIGGVAAGNRTGIGLGELGGPIGTVVNSGTVSGDTRGIWLHAGGAVIDAGTISGGSYAIRFGGTGSNLLALQTGYKLVGGVYGAAGAGNTIELLGSAASPITADYQALHLTSFKDALFGPGGYSTLRVNNTGGTLPVAISGFTAPTEILDLTAIGTNGTIAQFDTVAHRLTIVGSGGTVTLQLDTSDGTAFRTQSDGASGTDVVPVQQVSGMMAQGITLTSASSPLVITATGVISNGGNGSAVYGPGAATWSVANYGSIAATGPGGNGVAFAAGGRIGNSGAVSAGSVGVWIGGAAGIVTNSGSIVAGTYGVALASPGTVTNSGTIAGGQAAVVFNAAGDRLIVDPGAVFDGIVAGGGGTLELAAGSGTGILSGLGTSFADFAAVTIDAGAVWRFSGASTLTGSLVDGGTLMTGSLTVAGAFRNSGIIELLPGALDLQQGASGSGAIVFTAIGETVVIGQPGQPHTFSNPIVGFRSGDTIDVAGIVGNGYSYAAGVLTLKHGTAAVARLTLATVPAAGASVHLASDGSGGTSITLAPSSTGSLALSASATSPSHETTLLDNPGMFWHLQSG